MAQYDGKVTINTALDNSGFKSGVNNIKGSLGGLTGVLGKLGLAISAAFAVKKVVEFGAACVKLGSDVAEVQNVVDVAFGSMSDKMEKFADTSIQTYGMSKLAAKKTGSNYMAMAKGMGVASEAASDMAIGLSGLSGDVASFFNIDQSDSATKLKSVFTGETESLKEIGVVMTQANLQAYALSHGMGSNIAAMSQAQLVALRYAYVMDSLSLAQGDFARTQDSWANQTRILSMQWQEFMSIIGQALTTILLPLVKVLNTIVSVLIRMANAFNAAIQSIFGGSRTAVSESGGTAAAGDLAAATGAVADSSDAAADGQDALADSTKAAAAAAKKSLATFDELNVLQGNDSSSGSGGAGGGAGIGTGTGDTISTTEVGDAENKMSELQKFFNKLKEDFKEGFKLGFDDGAARIEEIKKDLASIRDTWLSIWNSPEVQNAFKGMLEKVAYNAGIIVGSFAKIGVCIAQNLVGGFEKWITSSKTFIQSSLRNIFDITGMLVDLAGKVFLGLGTIFEAVGSKAGQALTGGIIGAFGNNFLGAMQVALATVETMLTPFVQLFADLAPKIEQVLETGFGALAPLFQGIATGIADFYTNLMDLYNNVLQPILAALGSFMASVLSPLLDLLIAFNKWAKEHSALMETIGKVVGYLIGAITAVLTVMATVKVVGAALAGILTAVKVAAGLAAAGFAVLTSPITLVVAAVAAVIAIGVALYQNWDWVCQKAQDLYTALYTLGANLYGALYNFGSSIYTACYTFGENLYSSLYTIGENLYSALYTVGESIFTACYDAGTNIYNAAYNFGSQLYTTLQGIWTSMCNTLQTLLCNFAGAASGLWSSICTTASSLVSGGVSAVQGLWSGMCSTLGSMMSSLQGMFSSVWSAIAGVVTGAVNGIIRTVQGMIQTIQNAISSVMSALSSLGSRASSAVASAHSTASSVFGRSVSAASMASFSSLSVPALATGAVIPPNRQFLAMLGDQTGGTNVEAPLDTIKQAVAEVMAGMGSGSDGTPINIYLGEELLDTVIAQSQSRRALRSGGR